MLRNCAVLRKKSFRTVENDRERVAAFRNVAELADAPHSKSRDQKIVWVWAALPAAHPCLLSNMSSSKWKSLAKLDASFVFYDQPVHFPLPFPGVIG
jgi:hypothetical protein